MSVFLVRVEGPGGDGGGQPCDPTDPGVEVTLPSVLGRGSLLKCGEKRVSRRHAFLDWEEKGLLLTAVHQSPTFVQVAGAVQEVTEGSSVQLSHGDRFGFLRDRFWYMIRLPLSLLGAEEEAPPPSIKEEEKKEEKEEEASGGGEGEESTERNGDNLWAVNGAAHQKPMAGNTHQTTHTMGGGGRDQDSKEDRSSRITHQETTEAVRTHTNEAGDQHPAMLMTTVNTSQERTHLSTHQETTETSTHQETTEDVTTWTIKEVTTHTTEETQDSKGDEGDRKRERPPAPASPCPVTTSSSSSTSRSSLSPGRVTKKEVLAAISKKEKRLPAWFQNYSKDTPASTPPATSSATPPQRGGQARVHAAPTTDPPEDDGDLFSFHTPNKRQRKASPQRAQKTPRKAQKTPSKAQKTPTKAKRSPQKATISPPLAVKQSGGRGVANHHQISDDSGGEEETDTTATTTPTTTIPTTTASSHPSPNTPAKSTSPAHDQLSDSEEEVEGKEREREEDDGAVKGSVNPSTSSSSPPSAPPTAPTARRPLRPSCQYGASCYRRNPQHKQSEAHPGDSDYHGDGDSDDNDGDTRPECEYGVDCYRKNSQHRKDFKHTRMPQPQRKAKRKAGQQKGRGARMDEDDGEEDEYDLDDSFLNDDSSDDYAPTDGSSDSATEASQEAQKEEEEDTKRMLKEAKKFVKKRR